MPKLLLIEDNEHIQRIYSEKFRREGFDVTTARDGEKGLAAAYQNPPDVVLLDIMLPGIDGFKVLEQFRQDPSLHAVPVFMLSNRAWPDDVQRALQLGARRFYSKGSAAITDIVHEIRTECGFAKLLLFAANLPAAQPLVQALAHPRLLITVQTVLAELRAAVERGHPDVVLLDGRAASAVVALQQLRAVPALAHLPVLAIGNQASTFARADEVIPTDIADTELRHRIHRRLKLEE
ncbi:MAG: response regulator [Verrucomicrobiae bacterium]|nr:response regulator [Verrucomicrobiae bacterium]